MKVRRLAITLLLSGVTMLVPAAPAHAASPQLVATQPTTTKPAESTQDGRAGMTETDAGLPVWAWILISAAVVVAGALVAARLSGPRDR
jgi:hypothetical protein